MTTVVVDGYASAAVAKTALDKASSALQADHVDTDAASSSLHHTLGTGATNAAAGNHAHAAASTSAVGFAPQATAPAAGLRNVQAIDNGETARTDKALFDATSPAALGTAGAGSAMTAARRDHIHAMPSAANVGAEPTQTAVSQAEAEAGSESTVRSWTPVRVWQAITAKVAAILAAGIAPHLTSYTEVAATLAQSGATLTIPLDGKTYKVTPTAAITTLAVTAPTAPIVGWATVDIITGATPYAVSVPTTWYYVNGVTPVIADDANARTTLYLRSDYDGNIHCKSSSEALP